MRSQRRFPMLFAGLGALGMMLLILASRSPAGRPQRPVPPEEALRQARAKGKYEMLLRQFEVKKDAEKYTDFHDAGFRDLKEYADQKDLPKGYWVYVYPYWYIWRDRTATTKVKRPWGPEQATGEPDTQNAGDNQTAWASKTEDGDDEWLLLEYPEPVVPKEVLIYETFNPGAVVKVSVFKLDGTEVEAWKGEDPTALGSGMGVSEIPIKVDFKTNRVKIYIDSKAVPGWNEIDAVGLKDKSDKTHWASAAEASSTYAQGPYVVTSVEEFEHRLDKLEGEMEALKKANEKLRQENEELRRAIKKMEERPQGK